MFSGAISAEMQEAWAKIAAGLDGISSNIVATTLPFQASQYLSLGMKFEFPLLSLYRVQSRIETRTQSEDFRVTKWKLEYILPALTPLGLGKLEATRSAVDALLFDIINKGRHASYNDGYSLATLGLADIGKNYLSNYGVWEIPSGDSFLIHPALLVDFETKELVGFSSSAPSVPFEGADVEINASQQDPFALSSFALTARSFTFSEDSSPESLSFNPTGSRAWMVGTSADAVYEYSLSKYDVRTLEYSGNSLDLPENCKCFRWNLNGTKFFSISASPLNTIYEFGCSTPWNITTGTQDGYFEFESTLIPANTNTRGFEWSPDGSTITVVNVELTLHQYRAQSKFSVEGLQLISTFDLKTVCDLTINAQEIRWIDPWRFILVSVWTGKQFALFENDRSVPYGIQGITWIPGYFAPGGSTRGFEFKDSKLFVLDRTSASITEANLESISTELILNV